MIRLLLETALWLADGYWPCVRRVAENRDWLAREWGRHVTDEEYRAVFGCWPNGQWS